MNITGFTSMSHYYYIINAFFGGGLFSHYRLQSIRCCCGLMMGRRVRLNTLIINLLDRPLAVISQPKRDSKIINPDTEKRRTKANTHPGS